MKAMPRGCHLEFHNAHHVRSDDPVIAVETVRYVNVHVCPGEAIHEARLPGLRRCACQEGSV